MSEVIISNLQKKPRGGNNKARIQTQKPGHRAWTLNSCSQQALWVCSEQLLCSRIRLWSSRDGLEFRSTIAQPAHHLPYCCLWAGRMPLAWLSNAQRSGPRLGPGAQGPGRGWYRRRLEVAATRAFRLSPLSATAKLSTSRWLGVRSSGVLQKERMVRLLRLRPARAERKGGGWHWGWRGPPGAETVPQQPPPSCS